MITDEQRKAFITHLQDLNEKDFEFLGEITRFDKNEIEKNKYLRIKARILARMVVIEDLT